MTPYPKTHQTRKSKTPREDGDFSAGTVALILARDRGRCALCGEVLYGERGDRWGWHVHHREPRQDGGTNDPHISRASNGVPLHGSCHLDHIEKNRSNAERKGFIVRRGEKRAKDVPIDHAVHGRVYLDDLGWYRKAEVTAR